MKHHICLEFKGNEDEHDDAHESESEEKHSNEHGDETADENEDEDADPHAWLDPVFALQYAENIYNAACAHDRQ
ncbi:metal ABC transporter substrate-binding protein [Alkalihalobacillus oceani]|uniref:Metal ABC transporter substrate-binding protein n=1 Tax=Halalkalibacter oceani TaxID=1653776 RepID=A0A9X2DQY1_9BACI|nr:metal ABC transporter substrate-binding protein [Halalkalibacter oceani]MCM3715449.1 metal ABC transporter substrate-binding protein [Halalkalibacter oceani]